MGDDDDDHMSDDDQDEGDGCIWWFPGNLSPQIFTLALETLNAALNFSLFFLLLSSSILFVGWDLKILCCGKKCVGWTNTQELSLKTRRRAHWPR